MVKRPRIAPYVSSYRDAGGILRVRFRRGATDCYMKSPLGTEEWEAEYRALRANVEPVKPGASRIVPGTVADLVARFRASDEWARKTRDTKRGWNVTLDRLVIGLGAQPVGKVTPEVASKIMATGRDRPHAADNALKRRKALWDWGQRHNLVKDNPWRLIKPYAVKSDGHHTWSEAEVARFAALYPIGTREYLALALMLATFARKSDAVLMGWQHVTGNRLRFRSKKTGEAVDIPILPELADALGPNNAASFAFLMTDYGRPFTSAGFGNWFRDRCVAAGVPGRAHGLRKLAATRMAEAGATLPELMAWGGWKTQSEPLRYINAANRAKLADAGATKLSIARKRLDNSTLNQLNGKVVS